MIACAALTSGVRGHGRDITCHHAVDRPIAGATDADTADGDVAVGENTCEVNHVVDDHGHPDVSVAHQLGGLSKRRGVRPNRDDRELLDQVALGALPRQGCKSLRDDLQPAFVAIARGDRGAR